MDDHVKKTPDTDNVTEEKAETTAAAEEKKAADKVFTVNYDLCTGEAEAIGKFVGNIVELYLKIALSHSLMVGEYLCTVHGSI